MSVCVPCCFFMGEKTGKTVIHKVSKISLCLLYPLLQASMQFAECQCIIQCQEQEAMRFRLQHTLDVKVSTLLGSMGIKLDAFTVS